MIFNFNKGCTYSEFISTANDEQKEMLANFYEQGQLFEDGLDRLKNINKPLNLAVFSLVRCKDAATAIPFLLKLCELIPNVNIKFFDREGNEELLEELSGARRVPTILLLDSDGNVVKKYLEFPENVNKKIESSTAEDKEGIVNDFRTGMYNKDIQNDLIDLLT